MLQGLRRLGGAEVWPGLCFGACGNPLLREYPTSAGGMVSMRWKA